MQDSLLVLDEVKGHIVVDTNEPPEIFRALIKMSVPILIKPLNVHGHSDYVWVRHDGAVVEVERKTWGEILSDVGRVEEQMQRHLRTVPEGEHIMLLEGMVMNTLTGTVTLKPARGNSIFVKNRSFHGERLSGLYAWLYQMAHYIMVMPTLDMESSALMLSAMFKNDQKSEHSTMKRHLVKNDFHPDPYVTMVMGMLKGVGEKRALELKKHFPTVYSLVTARPSDLVAVDGVGSRLASEWCRMMGSPYG